MFLIRYFNITLGQYVVLRVSPAPADVTYPEKRSVNVREPKDGGVVIQRPVVDSRIRKWAWLNYRDTVPGYTSLWVTLSSLEVKSRKIAGAADVRVQIWENVTAEGGFGNLTSGTVPDLVNYTNLKWTWVKFIQVDRQVTKGGGLVKYDESTVTFVIDDTTFTHF